jgi:hypothetical protein
MISYQDVQEWEFDYDYVSHWTPLLQNEKHELRNRIVMLAHENMQLKSQENVEVKLESHNDQH